MNKKLSEKIVTCSQCSGEYQLSQCKNQQVEVPATNWPSNPGSTNIEFICPSCEAIIYSQRIK